MSRRHHPLSALVFALAAVSPTIASGQSLSWRELPAAPYTVRHNDVYFVSPEQGWIVNGDGEIYRTLDGGSSWDLQFHKSTAHFRSVGFVDAMRGFAGNVGYGEFGATDRSALYETSDGGQHWTALGAWNGPAPAGLCGMQVVNDTVVVAVGRVRGPASFVRTTDGGTVWRSKDMSAYAAGLIDVYFSHPDTGFVVGLTNVDHELSSGIVLYTEDGGSSWVVRHRTTRTGEWNWKISFPSRRVGYASLQRNSRSPIYFLKTVDGGLTWEEKLFSTDYYFVQGIGFIDESRGWIGGNSTSPIYETVDGGETWRPETIRPRLNRFRFFGDSLGYAVGRSVYKLADWSAVSVDPAPDITALPAIVSYPNPFSAVTTVEFTLDHPAHVAVDVYDLVGRRIARLMNEFRTAGDITVEWDGRSELGDQAPSGAYIVRIEAGSARLTRAIQRVR